ncbi:hypothetical protein [Tepidimonas taiwanensis]|uniref:hypothetical protein n=1 Tax=Tepidimonas taiwanensis TaxID=307486 RepID=UPI0005BB0EB7|nr:hypothetical protein [Tepidimonas taiwanensis]
MSHRLLFQPHNAIATAALTASSTRASRAWRPLPLARAGSAALDLTGSYDAPQAATLEVEAVTGGAPVASAPRYAGVGSGRLVVDAIDPGATAQSITLTLASLGVATEHASLDVAGARIVARVAGDAGNDIRITVTPRLVVSDAHMSTIVEWPAAQATQSSPLWEPLRGEPLRQGSVAVAQAPRVRFGHFPQVHRVYKVWQDGAWHTGLSPAPTIAIKAGTPVHSVSGSYDIQVTDGTTTETYTGIVTLYDALQALAGSALVRVDGVVVDDRTPGGIGAVDMPLISGAYVADIRGEVPVRDVSAPANSAITQTIELRCIDAQLRGMEVWSVTGTVSGRLQDAITGVPYASDAVHFTIAAAATPPASPSAERDTAMARVQLTGRGDSESVPRVCVRAAAGARARPMTVRFTYRKRPTDSCVCPEIPPFSRRALGLDPQGAAMPDIDPAYQTRLRQLYAWRDNAVRANTFFHASYQATNIDGELVAYELDLDFIHQATAILADCLAQVYSEPAALTAWDDAFATAQTDLQPVFNAKIQTSLGTRYLDRIKTACDRVLVEAGIVPKSNASGPSGAGSGYWQDKPGEAYWWEDESGTYLPVFTNELYYSVRRSSDGTITPTHEFGLFIGCGCTSLLRPGDSVEVVLYGEDAAVSGIRPDATAYIDVVAMGAAQLRGGVSGSDTRTWSVRGSVSGELPSYTLPAGGTTPHTAAGVTLHIEDGSIPFALGDTFTLDIEDSRLRWRINDDPWGAPADAAPSIPLAHGLTLRVRAGAAPSLVPGDRWRWALLQPHSALHVQVPDDDVWTYDGPNASITAAWPSAQTVHVIAAVLHDVPDSATVTASVSADGSSWSAPVLMVRNGPLALAVLPAPVSARALRMDISGAEGGSVRWWWAGTGFGTRYAARTTLRRQWALSSGDGINPATLCAGSGWGGQIEWDVLLDSEARDILDALHQHQRHGWPFIVVPHLAHPQDTAFARLAVSGVDVQDEFDFQADDRQHRVLRMSIPLQAVYQ